MSAKIVLVLVTLATLPALPTAAADDCAIEGCPTGGLSPEPDDLIDGIPCVVISPGSSQPVYVRNPC